jgi:hypothetical protein
METSLLFTSACITGSGRVRSSQRLSTLDADLTRHGSSHERQHGGSCLSKSCDPADTACEEPAWEDASSLIHDNGIDRTKQNADERNGHRTTYKRRNEPHDKLETTVGKHISWQQTSQKKRTLWRGTRKCISRAARRSVIRFSTVSRWVAQRDTTPLRLPTGAQLDLRSTLGSGLNPDCIDVMRVGLPPKNPDDM